MPQYDVWRQSYSKEQLAAAANNIVPTINTTTKNWQVWDIATMAWVDTGIPAAGKNPYIGANGHWYVWDNSSSAYVDTGVTAATSLADGAVTYHKLAPAVQQLTVGRNLLDNAYFVGGGSQQGGGQFPINQRGQTSYTGSGYGIDRWLIETASTTVLVESDGISIIRNSSTSYIVQKFPGSFQDILGRTVTFSFLDNNYECYSASFSFSGDAYQEYACGGGLNVGFSAAPIRIVLVNNTLNSTVKIKAAKLELGTQQTLAHQENGVWVLNEVPNYGEELAKCRTSTADSDDIYANQEIHFYANNAVTHRNIYRGKYLGDSYTAAQKAAVAAGTFDDLYVGDYWTIGGVNWRIADIDYWFGKGDTECTTHHLVIVPDTTLYDAKMNDSNITTGGYVGSKMYTENLATAKTTIQNAFGAANLLTKREFFTNAITNGRPSGGAWYDSIVDLMNEINVYGCPVFIPMSDGSTGFSLHTIDYPQFALFRLDPTRICNRATWWLRDVATSSFFALAAGNGRAAYGFASNANGVRPVFGIC